MRFSKSVVLGLSFALAIGGGCTKKTPKLDTDQQKASYTIGQEIGQNMKAQSVEVDPQAVALGLEDALQGKESRLKKEDMQAAMQKLQEATIKKRQEAGEANKKAGQDYLEKNKAKAGVKTTASGLQYEVLKEGKGKSPKETDTVVVHYTGTLTNGEKFDSSVDRGEPAQFPVNGVIKGWTEALLLMKVGDKWKLVIPPELAYGETGRPGIPPNSVLVFEVELMDIKK